MKKGISLRIRILLIFFAAVLMTVMVFFTMNYIFWNRSYVRTSQENMMSAYWEISRMVSDENLTEEEFISVIEMVNNEDIDFALQGDSDWDFMVVTKQMISSYDRDFLLKRLQSDLLQGQEDPSVRVRIIEKGDDYVLQQVDMEEGHYLECYGYMTDADGTERKFILSSSMAGIRRAFSASTMFFVYISLFVLVIGGLIIYFVTKRITKPILQLSDLSMKMSSLDFSARYQGSSRDELGILGNNMNELSSQLERTILQLQMANETLQKDIEEKEHVDEMRRDFISNVSHELKTPIALIQGYAEGLKEIGADDPESMAFYCDVITDEADKMNRMVKKLTTLNQLEFGADGLNMESFDIMEMIRSLVHNSKKMQEEHQAEVTVEGPESCMVVGDEFKIEEVVNNYYTNAYNHLEAPNQISFFFHDLGPIVRISVKNTGENIPEEELEKIWIKFYKVDKARTRAYGGSGIGLSIVKAIMDAHHREFGCYNEADGVVFWFELEKAEVMEDGSNYGGMGEGTEA